MVIRDFLQHFADDLILTFAAGQIGMVAMRGKHLRVHGQSEPEHLGAHVLQFASASESSASGVTSVSITSRNF